MLPETLRAGDELYRALLELSAEAIARFALVPPVRVDRPADEQVDSILTQARVAECNDAYAALYGRSTSETVGLSLHDLGGGERRATVARFVRGRYRITDSEVTHDLPDGSARWVSGSALGLVDGALLHGYWVALHDITARR